MDGLTLFGLFAVTAMLVCYALEDRSHWFILAFAVACALGSIYGFLQGAWPFGLVEAVWAVRCAAALEPQAASRRIARRRSWRARLRGLRQRRPRRFPIIIWMSRPCGRTADFIDLFKTEFPIVLAPMAGVMDAGTRDRRGAGRGAGLAALRDALGGEGARAGQHHPPARLGAGQHELLLPQAGRCRSRARGRMEAAARRLIIRSWGSTRRRRSMPPTARRSTPRCAQLVEELKPEVVSFHFGLPDQALLKRVKAAGCIVMASATIVKEAIWLEENGADVIIAQGAEAGGHRGMFLTENIAEQPGTFALVPQVVDAVKVPVIAAGGIADGRGIAAAFALGAAGVQIGSAYLRCPESKVIAPARVALAQARDDSTVITNVMTGRPARGVANRVMREVGPISPDAPAFPHAATALGPLKAAAEKLGKVDFTNLWAGQAVRMGREMPAAELTRALAGAALARLSQMAG